MQGQIAEEVQNPGLSTLFLVGTCKIKGPFGLGVGLSQTASQLIAGDPGEHNAWHARTWCAWRPMCHSLLHHGQRLCQPSGQGMGVAKQSETCGQPVANVPVLAEVKAAA